jgi:hypothetical protein
VGPSDADGASVGVATGSGVTELPGALALGMAAVAVGAIEGAGEAGALGLVGADGAHAEATRTSAATRAPIRRGCLRSELESDIAVALQAACAQ